MCKSRCISHVFIMCMFLFASAQAQAAAISTANAVVYWDTLTINDELVDKQDFFVDAEVSLFNDDLDSSFSDGDSFDTYLTKSGSNVSAVAGLDDVDDFYSVATLSNSIFSDQRPASSGALMSIYIPFFSDSSEEANIVFDYDLFASAEALLSGELALALASISYALLDDGFSEIESGDVDEIFAFAEVGADFPNQILGFFEHTFMNLIDGDSYFLAIDVGAFSATEAVVEAVPEPATFVLFFLGLAMIIGQKNKLSGRSFSNGFQLS